MNTYWRGRYDSSIRPAVSASISRGGRPENRGVLRRTLAASADAMPARIAREILRGRTGAKPLTTPPGVATTIDLCCGSAPAGRHVVTKRSERSHGEPEDGQRDDPRA